jgi:prepilin-type N-terminal cleavage/methylation domain-containing protein
LHTNDDGPGAPWRHSCCHAAIRMSARDDHPRAFGSDHDPNCGNTCSGGKLSSSGSQAAALARSLRCSSARRQRPGFAPCSSLCPSARRRGRRWAFQLSLEQGACGERAAAQLPAAAKGRGRPVAAVRISFFLSAMSTKRPSRLRSRTGVTLVELVIVLALSGVVAGAVLGALGRLSRLYAAVNSIATLGAQLAAAARSLALELRAASPTDILSVSDSGITYRALAAVALLCRSSAGTLVLAPVEASDAALARLRAPLRPGDSLRLFNSNGSGGGHWLPGEIAEAWTVRGACAASPLRAGRPWEQAPAWRLRLKDSLPAPPSPGSVVLIARNARFALYRGSEGEINLGWADWNATSGAWNVVQPLAGPLATGATARTLGRAPGFFAITGVAPNGSAAPALAGVGIVLRAATAGTLRAEGMRRGYGRDSLRLRLAGRRS